LCLSWNRARLPLRGLRSFVAAAALQQVFGGARGPKKGEPARTAEKLGSIALIAARARDRSRELRNPETAGKKEMLNPSNRRNPLS